MKWKNDIPNKTEFMKINSLNFIANEKFNSELVHENNAGKIQTHTEDNKTEEKEHQYRQSSCSPATDKTKSERRTMTETITITESKTDFNGSAPKRYISTCYIKPKTVPFWFNESLQLKIGSTKQVHQEKVYFKDIWTPTHWSETMSTEVKTGPKCILSEKEIPIIEPDGAHYISLIPQQAAKISTEL